MIPLELGRELLDMGATIGGGARGEEQLQGSVALYNMLQKHGVAYLADEVGMGKTYVALGVVALLRHFKPDLRLLVIAPRANIQRKWMKEMSNFVANNVRYTDLRTRGFGKRPARTMVHCENLGHLARAVTLDADRDFFARLTSFSLPLGQDSAGWRKHRDELRANMPWLPPEVFDLRDRVAFKRNFAHALCCAMPHFDLVIVDEAHHLKHGLHAGVAARNQVLAGVLGCSTEGAHPRVRRHLGPRIGKLLLLSATPVEETYDQLWNQLAVFGRGDIFPELRDQELIESERKDIARKFLIRRVTQMRVAGESLTKNLYRREWRGGGLEQHDDNIRMADDYQRLAVALVQKKVAELLGSEKFNPSFQIGMLASFESFLQTAKLTGADESASNFDDAEQTEAAGEREGVDVHTLNQLAREYHKRFGRELPHPKMDAVVESLQTAWRTGEKTLVFVRRVASVPELKRKLDQAYDEWLLARLRRELPEAVQPALEGCIDAYQRERAEAFANDRQRLSAVDRDGKPAQAPDAEADTGGLDTFFAWFFRGEGPPGVVSGANIQRRFNQKGTVLATFFLDNPVMTLLRAQPGQVLERLAGYLERDLDEVRAELRTRSARYLSGRAKTHARGDRFESVVAAAIELMAESSGPHHELAAALRSGKYEGYLQARPALEAPDAGELLEQPTYFTELARPERTELRAALWPEAGQTCGFAAYVRETEVRAGLLSMAARLGHAFIDLYVLLIGRLGSMRQGAEESESIGAPGADASRIHAYLDLLERQRTTPLTARDWAGYDELAELSANFELVTSMNLPDVLHSDTPLAAVPRRLSDLLQAQQPTAGMWGTVSARLVRQFRQPGYPFVLVTTDVLQEGEDLHTFCSRVQHYGISWTPSAMEQRVGRVDRVRSQTDRRFERLERHPEGHEKLQVFYPYLPDTVELLQVRRVLERTDTFLRLMHEGFPTGTAESKRIDIASELQRHVAPPAPYEGKLMTAFPVPEWALKGTVKRLAVTADVAAEMEARFEAIRGLDLPGLVIGWEPTRGDGRLLGTVQLSSGRVQPFVLLLKSFGGWALVRCLSPVGKVAVDALTSVVAPESRSQQLRLGALAPEEGSYNLTVEDDVLLAGPTTDLIRVRMLLERLVHAADDLERRHLNELDQPISRFETDLRTEGGRGNG